MANKIIHKRSSALLENGKPKLPTADNLEYGELAINFAKGAETISFKNKADEIVTICPTERLEQIIIDNEEVTAAALTDLDERMLAVENKDSLTIDDVYAEGFLTSVPSEYVTESELANKGYLTSIPANYVTESELEAALSTYMTIDELDETYATKDDLSGINTVIEENELVISNALTHLNDTKADKALVENAGVNNFKTFATQAAYDEAVNNEEIAYPCISYIEETGAIVFYKNITYNGVAIINDILIALAGATGWDTGTTGSYPFAPRDFFDVCKFNGVDMMDNTAIQNDCEYILCPSGLQNGDTFNVYFKFKDEIDSKYATTSFLPIFNYVEIDESFYNKFTTDNNMPLALGTGMLALNSTVKFMGDYDNSMGAALFGSLYSLIMFANGTTPSVTFIIPNNNATFGSPSDEAMVQNDYSTHTLYGVINSLNNSINFTVETY